MESRFIALKLFLQALGIRPKIKSFADRKIIQKAVYLGQALTGVDLGYRFSWYLSGPYQTALANDYYRLAEYLELGDTSSKNLKLSNQVIEKLSNIKKLMTPPNSLPETITQSEWLELLASYHYIRFVSKYSEKEASEFIKLKKGHLFPYLEQVKSELSNIKAI